MSKNMAKENYFVAARRDAIQQVKELIREKGAKGFPYKELMAYLQIMGFREKTVNEYIEVLCNAGFIKYNSETKAYVIMS